LIITCLFEAAKMKIKIAAIIAVVVILALWLNNKVEIKLNKENVSLSTEKNSGKDTVGVKRIEKSKVGIQNREGQNVEVEDVKDSSEVKVN
jgi:hypothetical protein